MKLILRRLAGLCFAWFGLSPLARATWSIVVVDTRTGEVCIASATCIPSFNLKARLAVVLVGEGAAAAQSSIDVTGTNRLYIWNGLQNGLTPAQIIQDLSVLDAQHQTRQYGIATLDDVPATFTGTGAAQAKYGVTGMVGDLRYAIQGNILVGDRVVADAEHALLETPGDLSQKVMAGMEAARARGGDGRCSCSAQAPQACGAPPPSFIYSAYVSFIVVARMGDSDGTCALGGGSCANGSYYCDLRVSSLPGGPEPVKHLKRKYDEWRNNLHGVADHIRTRVVPAAQSLAADGLSTTQVDVELVDVDGAPVTLNPATLSIVPVGPATPLASIGAVTDHGLGHLSFPVIAGLTPGEQKFAITVVHASKNVRLWPDLSIRVDALTELHSGRDQVSASAGASVPLVVNLGAIAAGEPYAVFGTSSGTSPGTVYRGVSLPLNTDAILRASVLSAGSPRFDATIGALDANGRAEATFVAAPGALDPFVGRHFDWAAVVAGHVTNVAGFDVVP